MGGKLPHKKICWLWQTSVSMEGKFLHKKYAGCGRHLFLWKENSSIEKMLAVADNCYYGRKIPPEKKPAGCGRRLNVEVL
jgi:hypothetical protein